MFWFGFAAGAVNWWTQHDAVKEMSTHPFATSFYMAFTGLYWGFITLCVLLVMPRGIGEAILALVLSVYMFSRVSQHISRRGRS